MSRKLDLKPVPPNLNKLKESYEIDQTLRGKLNIDSNIFTGSVKNWRNLRSVVDDYLGCSEVWEAQPQQFVLLLQTTLKTINRSLSKQPDNSTTTVEFLLKEYCSGLNTFYHHPQIINNIKLYYQKMELKKRDKDNLQQVHIQSNATASAIVFEKSRRLMEVESKKRSIDEVVEQDDCPVFSHKNSSNRSVARSCIIPTTIAEKKQWIKVFEFLAFLKHIVEKSLSQIDQLENESLGYVELGHGETLIKDYFN